MSVENRPLPGKEAYQTGFTTGAQLAKQPTAAQEERSKKLRRLNRWTIHLPVGLTMLLWTLLIAALVWLAIVGEWFAMDTNQSHYRDLFSGVADILTMVMFVPLLLLCAVPIAGFAAILIVRRRRAEDRLAPEASLPIFWRIENVIISIHDTVARFVPRLASPVIEAHASAAFVKRFIDVIKRTLRQETTKYDHDR